MSIERLKAILAQEVQLLMFGVLGYVAVSHMYKVGQQILEKEAPDSPKR